jgi:transcriptional regulator with XRE-family HTH domain
VAAKDLVYREFGLLLATERKRKHLSQSQLAGLAGMSRTSITNIECGRQPVQLHQVYAFASILHVDVHNLLPKESILVDDAVSPRTTGGEQTQFLERARRLLAQDINRLGGQTWPKK